jgi:PKD repeat protein
VNPAVVKTGTLTVSNLPPSVTITAPANGTLFQLADPVPVTASFTDAGTNDTHTCSIDFGDGTIIPGTVVEAAGAGTCTGTHAYSTGGMKTIKVTVTDDDGGSASASVTIDINSPPDCSTVTPDQNSLWPPNHALRMISLGGATDPDGDVVTLTVTAVTQDEALNGLGDGDTSPDAVLGPGSNQVQLRAERSGTGDGRVYHVAFGGSDGRGGTCGGTVNVGVPHNQKATPVDSELVVNSLG